METHARYIAVGLFVLTIIAAGFGFVYWLNNNGGGLGARAFYRIRFEESVAGLQIGAAVQFNGIRVGEVTALGLDPHDPRGVTATIAVDKDTPLRADTKVGVSFQGLLGTPAISLNGGTPGAPLLSTASGEPVLVAEPGAAQDLTQAARQALQHVDKILSDNSEGIKSTIDNIKTFSGALARNSNRIDGIMAGLERLAGGGPAEKPKPTFDLLLPKSPAPGRAPKGQLLVAMPTAVVALQTQRMLARAPDGQISPFGDAQWSDALPNLVQAKAVESFEDAGIQVAAASPEQQLASSDQLLIDLRDFTIAMSPAPVANIAFSAKLVDQNGHIVATKLFQASAPAQGTDAPQIAAAFDQGFAQAMAELVIWTSDSI